MSERPPAIAHGAPLLLADDVPSTLPALLARASAAQPVRGIVYLDRSGVESMCSYAALLADATRVASGLTRAGLGPGTYALLVLDDQRDLLTAFWGCLLACVAVVPLPLARTPPSLAQAARTVACWELLGRPAVVTSDRDSPWATAWLEHGARPRAFTLTDLQRCEPSVATQPAADDIALLLLTSGSTGAAKLVEHSHRTIITQCAASVQANGFTRDDVSLNWFPLDHVGGLAMFHLRDVFVGCQQVQAPIESVLREPIRWLEWIERYRATVTWAPNFAYALVADHEPRLAERRRDLSSLRFVLNGGEAIVARQARRFLGRLAPHGLAADAMHPAWGMSETCSGLTYSSRFSLDSTRDDDPFVEVGVPLPGASLRIVDEIGQLLREGETGALEVRSPSLALGYHGDPEATTALFSADGWLRTGDLAFLDDGRLTIVGRAKDVVIVGGINYAAGGIEAVAEEVPGVLPGSAIALGVRLANDTTDRLAILFSPDPAVRAATEDTATRIRAEVAAAVGVVARYVQRIDPSEVPRSAIGKVQRAPLRERVLAHALAARDEGPPVAPPRATAAPLEDRVREIVARVLQICADSIDAGRPLEDVVALDSLALVEIVSELEQELVLRIHGDALPDRVTLDDLIDASRRGQPLR